MEDIEQKLSSGNVFLQTQAITKLHTRALESAKSCSSLYEKEEVKHAWETANKGEVREATLAVEMLVALVKLGFLPIPATLQNFLADVTCAKTPSAILQGITEILLLLNDDDDSSSEGSVSFPFTGPPKGPVHPYVTLLNKRTELTTALLDEVSCLLRHPDQRMRLGSLKHVQPLLLHIFCLTETTHPAARPLLAVIINAHNVEAGVDFVPLLCRVTTLIKDSSKEHVERKVMMLAALAEIAVRDNASRLHSALLPCLVMALPLALKYGLGTRTLERYINTIASRLGRGCDVTFCALAEAFPHTAGQLQVSLLKLGTTLVSHKDGNPLIGGRLLPSLLQIMSDSCTGVPGLTTAAAALISLIQATPAQPSANSQLSGNQYWDTLCCTFSSLVSYIPALEFSDRLVKDPQLASDWLTKLSSKKNRISMFHLTIVTSVFLHQESTSVSVQEAAKVLEREVMKRKSLSLEVFPMLLYRLGREPDPTTRLTILYTLPSLAVNKLCVALVLKTLLALWGAGSLRPLVLRLFYDLWTVEPRTYPYLSKLIQDKSLNSTEIQIARAYVVAQVCKKKPSQHGEELLPLLSGFLNECRGEDGTTQTLIALDGIYDLCENQVIDLRTTWKVIAPKLLRDKRPQVTAKLCCLLGLVPTLPVGSAEYEKFTTDTLTILWNWTSNRSLAVVEAAYLSLEKFNYDSYILKMLPLYAREGHQLPASMAATPFEAARKPEDVLKYVPGLAWIKLIKGCPDSHLDYVTRFIKSLVSREVSSLSKGIYMTAVQEAKRRGVKSSNNQPEPPSYSFFKDVSTIKSLVNFLIEFPDLMEKCVDGNVKQRVLRSAVLALEALGQTLPRPYPALNWQFLERVLSTSQTTCNYDWTTRIRHSIFQITAQQCNKSPSASALISKWLIPAPSNGLTRQDEIVLFGLLDHLGRGLAPNVLQAFLAYIFHQRISDNDHLKALLEALKPNLTADFIFDTNRNVLSNAVENLNEHMDPANEVLYESYKECVADLPLKHIERLTSPSLWWEITDERLYRAAVLRCHVAEQDPEELALPWLNDLVDSAAGLPGDRSHLLRVMSFTLLKRCKDKESTTWLLQLLGRLQDHLKKKPEDDFVAQHEQQQRVAFYLDLLVMALIIWSGLWATNNMQALSETPVLRDRLLLPSLVTLSGQPAWTQTLSQILNWLVSCHSLLGDQSSRYHLATPILLLATLNPKISQVMWNKVIALLI